jgi:RNA polymerase sigma factor (sigma-70 family)
MEEPGGPSIELPDTHPEGPERLLGMSRPGRHDSAVDVGALFADHRRELLSYATWLVGADDAGDAVSDAMVSLLRGGQLEDASDPRALMQRAVLYKARSLQRSAVRRRAKRIAMGLVHEDPEIRPDIAMRIAKLSAREKACIYLTYWEDLPAAVVAERLDLAEGTVKKYLARARAKLREVIHE